MNTQELSKVCRQVRRDIITMTANAGSGHPGGSLSAVELTLQHKQKLLTFIFHRKHLYGCHIRKQIQRHMNIRHRR